MNPACSPPPLAAVVVDDLLRRSLAEDVGRGDVTTDSCVRPSQPGRAAWVTREALVVAGLPLLTPLCRLVDAQLTVHGGASDGGAVAAGTSLATVTGPAHAILKVERVALNFLQHLSGVATATRRAVDALPPGATTRIVDTRKTLPGLRALQRYAVRCGGGHNHRDDLGSAVLIKDNHIAVAGSVHAAINAARAHAPHTCRIECEVDTLSQFDAAQSAGADVILLDNFSDADVAEAASRRRSTVLLEASGNITPARIATLAALGVDVISIGALTHSVRAVDIGLDWLGAPT
ncbi:MAG: carboxylating nicotinate-nucleotide diphosphorylase [Polyangiales bacterium]